MRETTRDSGHRSFTIRAKLHDERMQFSALANSSRTSFATSFQRPLRYKPITKSSSYGRGVWANELLLLGSAAIPAHLTHVIPRKVRTRAY
jgi:hypothetical protein